MTLDHIVHKAAAALGAAVLAVAMSTGAGFAASDYVGKYKTEDTQGKPMEITLSEDGAAAGTREGEILEGKWKENKKGTAVIKWAGQEGWITKLSKDGDKYFKVAYQKGKKDEATKSEAEKVE
ncbi:MAG: hypothetical protein ACRECX_12780 [Methyloceanibacter sp.]|uniref:hypothetical protein n=1 Tax=Methyloceanibacter sp. TaxID=1965321 RepID=UPI003D6CF5A7